MNNLIATACHIFPETFRNQVYLVGGSVRDMLLGQANRDIDLISTLTPDEIGSCGFRLVTGKSTAPVWFRHDDAFGSIEATLIPAADGLTADLAGRDFTINAMAMTLEGEIIDPLNGRVDLNQRLLRVCSEHSFSDDPLRIFRALRFEAEGWRMVHHSELLIRKRDWGKTWSSIPVERFSREMLKALQSKDPVRFFERMLELKVGAEYLPEIFNMPQIPAGPQVHHPEGDLFTHSTQVLRRVSAASREPLTRFCAMFHDIGKLATSPALYPKHHGHDQAGYRMALDFCRRLKLPTSNGTALSWISRLHGTFNLWEQLKDTTKLKIADQAIKAGIVDVLPMVAAADKAGGTMPAEWQKVVTVAGMPARELGIPLPLLEAMQPSKRSDFIHQARIEKLRFIRTVSS